MTNQKIKSFFLILLSVFYLVSMNARAEDDDYDYLPPDEPSIFGDFTDIFADLFTTPKHPGSYGTAKKWLYRKIQDPTTFYCGCDTDLVNRTFDKGSCNYVPQNDNKRAHRLEAEHVVPAFWIANFHPEEVCWVNDEDCDGARDCCLKKSGRFKTAHNDLVNLLPTIGELNGDRSNFIYDEYEPEAREYGDCDFEVDSGKKNSEPKEDIRGDIARIHFYMRDSYGLVYPDDLAQKLEGWNNSDPISQAERDRNQKILETQGTSNPLVN